jgi:hypothetical protein
MLVLATKEDMREFSEDPTAMPLVLMYKGEVLLFNDMSWEFGDSSHGGGLTKGLDGVR